jgi:hypothetical protein
MIGRHFWTGGPAFLCPALPPHCSSERLDNEVGFTVTGVGTIDLFGHNDLAEVRAQVRLDDGRVGFFALDGPWYIESPQARDQAAESAVAHMIADCQSRSAVAIGMTEQEVLASKWGNRSEENTTETVAGTRVQWVYDHGPECADNGIPSMGIGRRTYLYFDNGHLVAIQR